MNMQKINNYKVQTEMETTDIRGLEGLYAESKMGNALVAIRTAHPRDVKDIENGYRSIQILPSCAADLIGFQHRGGMFKIPSESEISADCAGGQQRFIVAQEIDGSLCAIMRLGTDTSEYRDLIENRETLISYIELVIRCQHERFAYPFLYTCFRSLMRAGYNDMIFQIYNLLSWESESRTETLGFENHASKTLHKKLGAVKLGALPTKTLDYKLGRLYIRPDVYFLGLHDAVEKLGGLCRSTNWRLSD